LTTGQRGKVEPVLNAHQSVADQGLFKGGKPIFQQFWLNSFLDKFKFFTTIFQTGCAQMATQISTEKSCLLFIYLFTFYL